MTTCSQNAKQPGDRHLIAVGHQKGLALKENNLRTVYATSADFGLQTADSTCFNVYSVTSFKSPSARILHCNIETTCCLIMSTPVSETHLKTSATMELDKHGIVDKK